MVNRKFNNLLGIVLLVLFGICLLISGMDSTSPRRVIWNYRECVGIEPGSNVNYDWLLSTYGEPDSFEKSKPFEKHEMYWIELSYDGLFFKFVAENEEALEEPSQWSLATIRTTNPEHYFGRRKIHVGSTREEVIRAYKRGTAQLGIPLGEQYVDGIQWDDYVYFTYDENDIVTSIEF